MKDNHYPWETCKNVWCKRPMWECKCGKMTKLDKIKSWYLYYQIDIEQGALVILITLSLLLALIVRLVRIANGWVR